MRTMLLLFLVRVYVYVPFCSRLMKNFALSPFNLNRRIHKRSYRAFRIGTEYTPLAKESDV